MCRAIVGADPSAGRARVEAPAPNGVEPVEECPFPSQLGGLGSVVSSLRPQTHFLHILGHRTLLVERII